MNEVENLESVEAPRKTVVRAVLEGHAKALYDKVYDVLKAEIPSIKFTPSRLIGAVLKRYSISFLDQDKANLANEFFDPREHIKLAIKKVNSPGELEKALAAALERVRHSHGEVVPTRKRRGRPSKSQSASETSDKSLLASPEAPASENVG